MGTVPSSAKKGYSQKMGSTPLGGVRKKYAEECNAEEYNVGLARLGGSKWRIHPAKVQRKG